ncbi:ABC transporter substrate-binding protein [Tistrella bauzanensis]|uniref:ABC transporter substrate-binding protein n=1 Tax=Tistrella bauzanensis TaxID=657419 RepID=A0ABQ1IZ29_9PROT|nr:ABC transporter substrate-binding protein [Tistrella bauzanensis]GGB55957.1 ABC transporter substrate-binding protein [Tistrella bauzanensis]
MIRGFLLGGVAALSMIFAAAAAPVEGGRANVVIQPEPPGLMLGMIQNGPTQMVAGNIYEGLLRYDPSLKPMPQLAESWTVSGDGTIYTFKLRQGVTWHDGEPFTSADVVFSVDVFLRETHARLRASLVHVENISAPDDHTVVFKLKQPFGPFLGIFEVGTMPMVPKHIYEGTDFKTNPANNTPIGTGPFKFKEWVKGSHILLVKNENYYQEGKPHLDEIYWHVIPDAASRAVAFETGTVDILPGGSVENFDVQRLTALDNTCVTDKGWEFFAPQSWLWLNNREGPTADVRFRKAIMYAMDREFAKEVLWNGLGDVATGPFSSKIRFYSDKVTPYPHDPDKARELLKEMGYDGTPIRLLPLPYGETWQRWAEAVKQNLEEVGIKVELVATDVAGWNQKVADWDYDLAFTYLYQYGDPALGVSRTYVSTNIAKGSPWNNVAGYASPEVDKLFADGAVAFSDKKREGVYTAVQKKLVDDVPVAWLLELGFPTIYRCNVKNLITTGIGVNDGFKDAWIE